MANDNDMFNSSTKKLEDVITGNTNTRVKNISSVMNNIGMMENNVQKQIRSKKSIDATPGALLKILDNLNKTVGSLAEGTKNITTQTAIASKDAVKQYGKAVSQDISFNKQNIVAMSLAKSTPIFGYFASKFMETTVFQEMSKKIKDKMEDMLSSVFSKFKLGFSNFFSRFRKGGKTSSDNISEIPSLQKGGYVEKGGMVNVHPGEVVAPIEKILSRLDERQQEAEKSNKINKFFQMRAIKSLDSFVMDTGEQQKTNIITGFFRAYQKVHRQFLDPYNVRMLRSLLAIQNGLGIQLNSWKQIYFKMLAEHPTFRSIILGVKTLKNTIGAPLKLVYSIFKARGGYQGHLPKSKNAFANINNIVGMTYVGTMWRLDNLILYLKAQVQAQRVLTSSLTGHVFPSLPGIAKTRWSFASGLVKLIAAPMNILVKKLLPPDLAKSLTRKRMTPLGLLRRKFTERGKKLAGIDLTKEIDMGGGGRGEGFNLGQIATKLILEDLEKIKKSVKIISKNSIGQLGYDKKQLRLTRETNKGLTGIKRRIKGVGSSIWKWGLMAFGLFKAGFGKVGSLVAFLTRFLGKGLLTGISLLSPVLMKLSGFLKPLVGMIGRGAAGIASFIAPTIAPILGIVLAGAAGVAIGSLLNKFIISPLIKKWSGGIEEKTKSLSSKFTSKQAEYMNIIKQHKEGKVVDLSEYKKARASLKISAGLAGVKASREEGYGRTTSSLKFRGIELAQQNYMNEHINEYLKYGSGQVNSLRQKWAKGQYFRGKTFVESMETYGKLREQAFLDYLKIKGIPLSETSAESLTKSQLASLEARKKLAEIKPITSSVKKLETEQKSQKELLNNINNNISTSVNVGMQNTSTGNGGNGGVSGSDGLSLELKQLCNGDIY